MNVKCKIEYAILYIQVRSVESRVHEYSKTETFLERQWLDEDDSK